LLIASKNKPLPSFSAHDFEIMNEIYFFDRMIDPLEIFSPTTAPIDLIKAKSMQQITTSLPWIFQLQYVSLSLVFHNILIGLHISLSTKCKGL
jgi:hypothetical protein